MTEILLICNSGWIGYCYRCPTVTQTTLFLENWSNKELSLKTLQQASGYGYSWLTLQKVTVLPIEASRILKFRQTCDITWFPVGLETTLCVPQYSLRLPTANANRPSVHFKHLNPLLSTLKYCENAPF